jgi:hypothetical protein
VVVQASLTGADGLAASRIAKLTVIGSVLEGCHVDAMVARIVSALRETGYYGSIFPASDTAGIEAARAAGRRAGRQLGWKIRTLQGPPATSPDGVYVGVHVVVEQSTPLQDELFKLRREAAMREAMRGLSST